MRSSFKDINPQVLKVEDFDKELHSLTADKLSQAGSELI